MDPGLFEVFAVCYRVGDVFLGDDAYRLAGVRACRTMRALAPACFIRQAAAAAWSSWSAVVSGGRMTSATIAGAGG